MWVAVAAALGSALCFALSTAVQHISAGRTPRPGGMSAGALGRFALDTLREPLWLLGLVVDVLAFFLHALALHLSSLSLVQPLLVVGIVFTLPIQHRILGTRIRRAEVGWSVVLTVALAAFLFAATPVRHAAVRAGTADRVDRLPAYLAVGLAVAAVAACMALARGRSGTRAAVALGTAAGVSFAATAALLKVCSDQLAQGPVVLVTHPQLYLLAAVGAGGLVLHQLAFQAGPLSASLPAFTVVDPLLSVALGVAVFDEVLRTAGPALFTELCALVAVTAAAIRLSTYEATAPVEAGQPVDAAMY